jgi:ribonuclease Z
MIIKAYSKGLYSNWYFYAPDRVLFDCGEGAALNLRAGIFAIEKIFLSHGHIDHIAGLPLLVSLRQSTTRAETDVLRCCAIWLIR